MQTLDLPVGDHYRKHWSITGRNVPGRLTPVEAVYLPGRSLLLLSKAMLWCHLNQVNLLMLGVLAGNPFPDATESYFLAYEQTVNQSVKGNVRIEKPFSGLTKVDVIQRGRYLPLALT